MSGWIKLHRQLNKHWIWENPDYLKAWISILIHVNFEEKKVLIDKDLIVCSKGQSLHSLQGWVKIFGKGWTIQKVRTFFSLLQKDSMINTEGLRKTTRLTVCNYGIYQIEQQADNTQVTSKQQADNTQVTDSQQQLKNDNNANNEKEVKEVKENSINDRKLKFAHSLKPFLETYSKEMIRAFCDYWTEHGEKDKKFRAEKEKSFSIERRLKTWKDNESKFNKNGSSTNQGYKPASVDREKLIRELTEDAQNGNIPGEY